MHEETTFVAGSPHDLNDHHSGENHFPKSSLSSFVERIELLGVLWVRTMQPAAQEMKIGTYFQLSCSSFHS